MQGLPWARGPAAAGPAPAATPCVGLLPGCVPAWCLRRVSASVGGSSSELARREKDRLRRAWAVRAFCFSQASTSPRSRFSSRLTVVTWASVRAACERGQRRRRPGCFGWRHGRAGRTHVELASPNAQLLPEALLLRVWRPRQAPVEGRGQGRQAGCAHLVGLQDDLLLLVVVAEHLIPGEGLPEGGRAARRAGRGRRAAPGQCRAGRGPAAPGGRPGSGGQDRPRAAGRDAHRRGAFRVACACSFLPGSCKVRSPTYCL